MAKPIKPSADFLKWICSKKFPDCGGFGPDDGCTLEDLQKLVKLMNKFGTHYVQKTQVPLSKALCSTSVLGASTLGAFAIS